MRLGEADLGNGAMTRSWRCGDCGGSGMYQTATGMRVCDCDAGRRRREYLGMTDEERRQADRETRRRKRGKPAETETQEEVPF